MNNRLKRLYRLTDTLLYPLMYHIVRYRRKTVRRNLVNSFPEMSEKEIICLEKQYYRHFADIVAEVLYASRATQAELAECIEFTNLDDVEEKVAQHGGVIYMLGHLGNWELTADVQHHYQNSAIQHYNVYRRLNNSYMDRKMMNVRERMSSEGSCLEKHTLLRKMIGFRQENKLHTIGLISDQKPRPETTRYWCNFLNQDTGWLDGGEVLSGKFGYPVYYVHISETERGHYIADSQLITDEPGQMPKHYITEQFAKRLEENIRENPSLWLWSHNRWKWTRNSTQQAQTDK